MPSLSKENWEIVNQIYNSNNELPYLPPEIWMIIFDSRDALIRYEESLPMDIRWNNGWRPDNYPYKTSNWIEEGKLKYWLKLSIIEKIFWKLGISKESKLEYWDENPGWFCIVFNNIMF